MNTFVQSSDDEINDQIDIKWVSTSYQLPVVKKGGNKQFNVVMLNYKGKPFVTSLNFMNEYEFYDEDDNFEKIRNDEGHVYHTGWVNHLNDDYFEPIDADKVLFWTELPQLPKSLEQSID